MTKDELIASDPMGLEAKIREAVLWAQDGDELLKKLVAFRERRQNELCRDFFYDWFVRVFNMDTADSFGLGIWSRILNAELGVNFDKQEDKIAFGFGENRRNFAPSTNFGARDGSRVGLTVDQARAVIRARYFKLTHMPTFENINLFLQRYFWQGEEGKVYVIDTQDMQFAYYIWGYEPDGALKFLMDETDFLPRPFGVGVKYEVITKKAFGFGQYRQNFAPHSNFGSVGQ